MSEFKRQIAAGATVAVIVTFVLALGVATLFPGATANESSTTAAVTSGATTSSQSIPATSASSSSSTTSSIPSSVASSSTVVSSTALTASGTTTIQTTSSTSPISSSSAASSSSSTGTISTATTASSSTTIAAVTSSTTSPVVTSGTVSSTTTAFTTPESSTGCYTCGVLKIESANLTVDAAGNGAVLSLIIFNDGGESATNLTVSLDSVEVVVVPALAAGTQTLVSIQVPGPQLVQVGQSYGVSIQGGYEGYLVGATASVEASS